MPFTEHNAMRVRELLVCNPQAMQSDLRSLIITHSPAVVLMRSTSVNTAQCEQIKHTVLLQAKHKQSTKRQQRS